MSIVEILKQGFSYAGYRSMIDDLLAEGKTTGEVQTKERVEFTKINVQRMNRLDKTVSLTNEMQERLKTISKPVIWLVVAEAWCGDSAQVIPVVNKIAQASGGMIELKIILRDSNPEMVETYKARSIPKLLCIDKETMEVVDTWGARPKSAQEIAMKWKNSNGRITWEEFEKELHLWYARDKGVSIINELINMVLKVNRDISYSIV